MEVPEEDMEVQEETVVTQSIEVAKFSPLQFWAALTIKIQIFIEISFYTP